LSEKIDNLKSQIKTLPRRTKKKVSYSPGTSLNIRKGYGSQERNHLSTEWPPLGHREFIDHKAAFGFIDEKAIDGLNKNSSAFDIRGGEFTH